MKLSTDWVKGNVGNVLLFVIDVVPQERISIVKPQRGKICFTILPFHHLCSSPQKEKHIKPQQGKSKRNPREESLVISNPKEDPS